MTVDDKNPVKVAAGQKGGRARTDNKRRSSSANLAIARAKRWPGREANVRLPISSSIMLESTARGRDSNVEHEQHS